MQNLKKIICVVGPTASGKTDLGVKIASLYNGEIISADSMQIYKGVHIASAAPDKEEKCGIEHHLIEFLPLGSSFTVADYTLAAREKIDEITARDKIPIIVGGTGLYINSLVEGIEYIPTKTDDTLREELNREMDILGGEEMLLRLSEIDSKTASKLHSNDRKRIIRAFEVYRTTGRTMSEINAESKSGEKYDALMIGISFKDRDKLYDRINRRVDMMLEKGLVEEAKAAMKADCGGASQAIGHKELFGYLRGEMNIEEAAENLKQATRRYAKRQLTWFRKSERINWIWADHETAVLDSAKKLIDEWREQW